jgi:hypothetical protein
LRVEALEHATRIERLLHEVFPPAHPEAKPERDDD